jgi:uncharacterized protein (TIGR00730 family)
MTATASVGTVCVFAGSARVAPPDHTELARDLGARLGTAGMTVVYGGGSRGLMGAMADAALDAGARVIGVVPRGLFAVEEVHPGRVEVVEVDDLLARKRVMIELSDAFVVLPGGLGTLDELAEVVTWAQLGLHGKRIVLLDADGYWAPLLRWVDDAVEHGYVSTASRRSLTMVGSPAEVVTTLGGDASRGGG